MLQRTLIAAAAGTLLVGAISFYNHVRLRPGDLDAYFREQAESSAPRSRHALQKHPATQERKGVHKDLRITQPDGSRSHLCLESETSTLTLSEKNGKIEAEEELRHLKGESARDDLRRFTATNGVYYYPSHRFFAHHAHLELFRQNAPFLKGVADEVTFSASSQSTKLLASHLKIETQRFDLFADSAHGKFSPDSAHSFQHLALDGHVRCEEKNGPLAFGEHARYSAKDQKQGHLEIFPQARLEWDRGKLICDGPLFLHSQECLAVTEEPLHYRDEIVELDASMGRLSYGQDGKNLRPQTLCCEGQIRIISEQNYAIADRIVYFPTTKTLHLFAEAPSRVLFWKADGSIQISAPEVIAVLDREREEISGIGDVHFTFDLEEENKIENLFGNHLL